jgi:hypothetical protein
MINYLIEGAIKCTILFVLVIIALRFLLWAAAVAPMLVMFVLIGAMCAVSMGSILGDDDDV